MRSYGSVSTYSELKFESWVFVLDKFSVGEKVLCTQRERYKMGTKGNVVVHVREDSREDLEALFNHLMNPAASVVPMRNRNLPPSFFNPSASDRRNNNSLKPPDIEGLSISHSRAHSSPAAFTVPANSPPNLSTHHSRSQSYDSNEEGPLPPGWEMATTESGLRYFMK